jgi:hypothetical protein
MEMLKWWLLQPDLIRKTFDDIIPRLRDTEEPYTYLLRLPKQRIKTYTDARIEKWYHVNIGALEINGKHFYSHNFLSLIYLGNRFPALKPLEDRRVDLLKEYIAKHGDVVQENM